ncbi:NAD(P)-binding protein [Xylariomycetidae sp. FL2044]|nr:NAD(P)-binding protein [Xylariomycetidae sp. FL2044]
MPQQAEQKPQLGSVLIIGGCGFLGHHIVNLLLRDWTTTSVAVIDLKCERNRRPESDGVHYVEADITDADGLVKIFGRLKPNLVIHTASPTAQGIAVAKHAHAIFHKVNVDGTRAVVEACKQTGVRALVYTSSSSIMSDNKADLINANEDYPVIRGKMQTEYYSETKAEAEDIVLKANRSEGTSLLTTSIRPSGIFGEGDAQLIPHVINICREGKDKVQVGVNENLFDFTYVENVAHAHLLAARALLGTHALASASAPLDHERVDGEAFVITNGSPVYFWDFMRSIWRAAGSPRGTSHVWVLGRDLGILLGLLSEAVFAVLRQVPTFNRQRIVYSSMTRYFDISKAKQRLGYEPLVGLSEGVRRSVAWTLEQEEEKKRNTKKG